METGPSTPKIMQRHRSEASTTDLNPLPLDTAGPAAQSDVVDDGGNALKLTHSVTATHQSSEHNDDTLTLESDLQHIADTIGRKPFADNKSEFASADKLSQSRKGLEHRLLRAMLRSKGKGSKENFFVPTDEIDRLVNTTSVVDELKELGLVEDQYLMRFAHRICSEHGSSSSDGKTTKTTRQRFFAILVLMQETGAIFEVIREGLYDSDLPLTLVTKDPGHQYLARRNHDNSSSSVHFSREWANFKHELFDNGQWKLLSPCFEMRTNTGDKINHYWFHPQSVLPITDMDEKEVRGGFSTVAKIRLHPAHWNRSSKHQNSSSWLALKRLLPSSTEQAEQEFKAEAGPLKRLSNNSNPHFIPLLATFYYQEHYNLVFQWADGGNLFDFWSAHPLPQQPPRDQRLCIWLSNQLIGLASALSQIHNCRFDPGAANMSGLTYHDRKRYGVHGDLKPENILWFMSEDGSLGTFKISDFGLTSFHGQESRQRFEPRGVSQTYRAPEYELDKRVSQKYDMWTLGCVLAEFLTWYLLGIDGVSAFTKSRREKTLPNVFEDSFFSIKRHPDHHSCGLATEKLCVKKHFDMLQKQPNCSDFISDIIDFVQDRLLRMSSENRCEVSEFLSFSRRISKQCSQDKRYCTEHLKPITERAGTGLSEIESHISLQPRSHRKARASGFSENLSTNVESQREDSLSCIEDTEASESLCPEGNATDQVEADSSRVPKEYARLDDAKEDNGPGTPASCPSTPGPRILSIEADHLVIAALGGSDARNLPDLISENNQQESSNSTLRPSGSASTFISTLEDRAEVQHQDLQNEEWSGQVSVWFKSWLGWVRSIRRMIGCAWARVRSLGTSVRNEQTARK